MVNNLEKEREEYPRRRRAVILLESGEESVRVPIEISCRADGECVLRHPRMEELMFPKVVKKGEKAKKEVKK